MTDARPPDAPEDRLRIAPAWLRDADLQALLRDLATEGATTRFVGGCVRNAILAAGPTDIDVAIDRPPKHTIARLEAAGRRAIPTGVEHGTVTTVLADGEPIEITSLRRDVATDGRRAVVAFTEDWAEDAARRDFSMNALYADAAGWVFDPLGGGIADLRARRLRFIGDAEQRIREDYLRILRLFRFHAWYGGAPIDAAELDAAARLRAGIDGLARERIGAETRKLLAAPDPSEAARSMAEAGVLAAVSDRLSAAALAPLVAAERREDAAPAWMRRLAAMTARGAGALGPEGATEGADELATGSAARSATEAAAAIRAALKLSNEETGRLTAILSGLGRPLAEAAYRLGPDAAADAALIALSAAPIAADAETPVASAWRAEIAVGAAAVFPLRAQDLIDAGVPPGPALGAALKRAETAWVAARFAPPKDALLAIALDP